MKLAFLSAFLLLARPVAAAPRLLVVVSVDQMRADYLDRFAADFKKGFKILFEGGSVWTKAHHSHVPTETGPGHAVILTGRTPDRTGIVSNEWWDRSLSTPVYTVRDSVHGLGPENLQAYTVGDARKALDPKSRMVSVSLKDRSAILMGGKKADMAIWYDKKKGEFTTSSYYGAKPEWLGGFNAKLKDKGGILAPYKDKFGDILATADADKLLLELVQEILVRYELGLDDHADILAVSFSGTDYVGHKFGPDSAQMKEQMLSLDAVLGEMLGTLRVHAGEKNFDLALTADHAVIPLPEGDSGKTMKARRIMEKDMDARLESALQALNPAPGQKWLLGHFSPNVYLNRALAKTKGLGWPQFLAEAARTLRKVDGVAQVYIPGEWDSTDAFSDVFKRSYHPARSGDLLLRVSEGVLLAFDKTGTTHGTPYPYDTHVPLIFWGPDFKTGLSAGPARVTDLAPTCAKLLDVEFAPAEGSRVLTEAFPARP